MDSPRSMDFFAFSGSLISSPSASGRAAVLGAALREALPDTASVVYELRAAEADTHWSKLHVSGEVSVAMDPVPGNFRLFAPLLEDSGPLVYAASTLQAEDLAHLHVTRSLSSVAYIPMVYENALIGCVEILAFDEELTPEAIESLDTAVALAAAAIVSSERTHREQQDLLDSIHRLTQLYDLEKSLNSSLDIDQLMELVPEKVAAMLPCQAIHLWLFDGSELRLMSRYGFDATVEVGSSQGSTEGYVGEMAEEGEPTLIVEADDPRLTTRNAGLEEGDSSAITTAVMVPLMEEESEIGVVEAVNKAGGEPFDDDDLFFLSTMSETISSALKNASLMYAERKLEVLQLLVQVSSEITSTLRLDRLLQIIVNSPQSVLQFERCSAALDHHGKLQLKAVSGMDTIRTGDVTVEQLRSLLHWLSSTETQLLVRQHDDAPEHDDPEVRERIGKYFEETGVRALFVLPLTDDQGRVGLLVYESSSPDFLEVAQIEMIKVIAGQATVAIRNALLYREVPLISLMEPLLQGKRVFLRSSRKRRWAWIGATAAVVLFLVFCPLPMRLSGNAVVAPRHIVTVASPVEGVVETVNAQEGQHVSQGAVLGAIGDMATRRDYAAAQTKYETQMLAMQSDLATQSPLAGRDRTQAEFLRAEMERAQQRIENTQFRSPIDGIVVTPHLQNVAGQHLDAGAPFAQVLDVSSVVINVAVDEEDAPLLRPGQPVSVKLNSFPTLTLHGTVAIVSPKAEPVEGKRFIFARIALPNADASLRDGMDGRAKILAGYRPAGYVFFRRPALFVWQTLWNWIGW